MYVFYRRRNAYLFVPRFIKLYNHNFTDYNYNGTLLIRINWDGKPPGYAENPDNWVFL